MCKEDPATREDGICPECDAELNLRSPDPEIFYRIIASGNQVIKNREQRDWLHSLLGALYVETEAFRLMNNSPCLVI
jgi:hypothetical protein